MIGFTSPAVVAKADLPGIATLKGGIDASARFSVPGVAQPANGVVEFLGFAGRREADGMYRGVFRFRVHAKAPLDVRHVSFDKLIRSEHGADTTTESEDTDVVQSLTDNET